MFTGFTASHRGGSGAPLVLLHGFMDTWRIWDLVRPTLEHRHDVLALTLPGHAGGPPLEGDGAGIVDVLDAVECAMDEAGFATAHLVGNSLGGYVALRLAARGRADSVVALAPAGGWAPGDESFRDVLRHQRALQRLVRSSSPHAEAIVATAEGRRRATELQTTNYEHIPAELLAHQVAGIAGCTGTDVLVESALRDGWSLDAGRIDCPVRIVWGTADVVLPWPFSAARYRSDWLPHADWVELEGVGHCPQLDVPLETAHLILGFTTP